MMIIRAFAATCALVALGGCATIVEGTTQPIMVEVVPSTGTCVITRQGETIGASTPDQRVVVVSKSMNDLEFDCSAAGHQPRREVLSSSLSPATVASFFLLDFGLVDAATGAWKKYPEKITIVLQPIAQALAPVVRQMPGRRK